MNQGHVGGAGIAAHLHQHVVPRWGGDTNFMPVVGQTKVIPQSVPDTRDALRGWPPGVAGGSGSERLGVRYRRAAIEDLLERKNAARHTTCGMKMIRTIANVVDMETDQEDDRVLLELRSQEQNTGDANSSVR